MTSHMAYEQRLPDGIVQACAASSTTACATRKKRP
jgi:hypothetical protein